MTLSLYPHQCEAVKFIAQHDGMAGLFLDMRTGKSRIALVYAQLASCRRILIVCPISACSVWTREHRTVLDGWPCNTALTERLVDLTQLSTIEAKTNAIKSFRDGVILTNYESYWREPLRSSILKWKPDAVILDEAQRIRARGTKQSRFAHTLGAKDHVRCKLALTGTPIGNGLQDIFSIYKFLDPSIFGTWLEFAARYFVMNNYLGFPKIDGYINEDEAHDKIAATSYQFTRQDVGQPPQDIRIDVQLCGTTRQHYDRLKKEAIIELRKLDGQSAVVIARTALTMLIRLQQIACGFAGVESDDPDEKRQIVNLSDEKVDVTLELVEQAKGSGLRVVIFCRFLHDLDKITYRLQKGGYSVGRFDGSVVPKERAQIITNFQEGMYDALVVQIRTGSLGIELSAGCIGIFYSTGFSLDDWLQARARLLGPNQHRDVCYYHIVSSGTVDEKVLETLQAKIGLASRATDLAYMIDVVSS